MDSIRKNWTIDAKDICRSAREGSLLFSDRPRHVQRPARLSKRSLLGVTHFDPPKPSIPPSDAASAT